MAGKPLPLKALLLRKCGDWAWMKMAALLTGWRDGPNLRCCFKCRADTGDSPWWDASVNASWRGTIFHTLAAFWETRPARSGMHAWPGCHPSVPDIDWMHSSDLGPVVSFLGNVWHEIWISLGGTWDNADPALATLLSMHNAAAR